MTLRRLSWLAMAVVFAVVVVPIISLEQHKAAYACSALVLDPTSAINLQRHSALRYKSAPLRICVPEDGNNFGSIGIG